MPRESAIPDTEWNGDEPPKGPGVPKREHCGTYVSGGMTSYPCRLGIGHAEVPKEDPEPHCAPESSRSVIAWQNWAKREWARRQSDRRAKEPEVLGVETGEYLPSPGEDVVVCADGVVGCEITDPHTHVAKQAVCSAGLAGCELTFPHTHGVDGPFDQIGQKPAEPPLPRLAESPDVNPVVRQIAQQVVDGTGELPPSSSDRMLAFLNANFRDAPVSTRIKVLNAIEEATVWVIEARTVGDDVWQTFQGGYTKADAYDEAEVLDRSYPNRVHRVVLHPDPNYLMEHMKEREDQLFPPQMITLNIVPPGSITGDNGGGDPETADDPTVYEPGTGPGGMSRWMVEEAKRTRPEDQRLPDGDESLPDDQSLLIEDIEKRRQVGIQRYGQGHRPFNGRNTLQDWYEEDLDGLVYLRSIVRMGAAAREELIPLVTREMLVVSKAEARSGEPEPWEQTAERVVDRIMGWVTAKIIDWPTEREALVRRLRVLVANDRIAMQGEKVNPEALVDEIADELLKP